MQMHLIEYCLVLENQISGVWSRWCTMAIMYMVDRVLGRWLRCLWRARMLSSGFIRVQHR